MAEAKPKFGLRPMLPVDAPVLADIFGGELTLVATLQGSPVAFAALEGPDKVDMLYVHPAVARNGIATMLVDALEKLAGARGAKLLTAEASDTAREFFAHRGYTAQHRSTLMRGGEWLSNTTMTKQLVQSDRSHLRPVLGGKS
jgi:putative acetyltransferase